MCHPTATPRLPLPRGTSLPSAASEAERVDGGATSSFSSRSTECRILELRRRKSAAASVLASSLARSASSSSSSSSSSSRLDGSAVASSAAGRRRASEGARPTPHKTSSPTKPNSETDGRDNSSDSSRWTVVGSPEGKSVPAGTPPRTPVAPPPSELPALEETDDESDFLASPVEDLDCTPPREEKDVRSTPMSTAAGLPPSLTPPSTSAKKRRTRRKLRSGLGGPRGSGELAAKIEEIDAVLRGGDDADGARVDLWRLRRLALSEGGLVNDALRKRAWPMLVGLHEKPPDAEGRPGTWRAKDFNAGNVRHKSEIPPRRDAELIEKDAKRTSSHLLAPSQRTLHAERKLLPYKERKKLAARLRRKQRSLGDLIRLSLVPPSKIDRVKEGEERGNDDDDEPRYYQGYHDLASVFLSALRGGSDGTSAGQILDVAASLTNSDLDLPARVLRSVASTHLRDFTRPTLSSLLAALRITIMPLLELFDPEVHDRLVEADVEPYFALGWVSSWFSHDVDDTPTAKRLYDAFLAGHPLLPFFMSVAVVTHPANREAILNADPDLPGVMGALQGLPQNSGRRSAADDGVVDDLSSTGTCDAATVGSVNGSLASLSDLSEGSFLDRCSMDASHLSADVTVPIQELIDLAVSYMERAPPQNLLSISRHYYEDYSDNERTETTLPTQETSSVHLFRPPPVSVTASTCLSERALELLSQKEKLKTKRRARRRRLELRRRGNLSCNVGAGEVPLSSASPSQPTSAPRRGTDTSDLCRSAKIAAGVAFDDEAGKPTMARAFAALESASAALFSGISWALGKAERMPQ